MTEDGELLEAAGGDRARARMLNRLLQHLSEHSPDERLREMASSVLSGQLTVGEAVGSSYYGEAIAKQTAGFTAWYESLSDDERAEQARVGAAEIDKLRDEIDREAAAHHRDPLG